MHVNTVLELLLEPKYLDDNIRYHIIRLLNEKYKYMSEKIGYILDVITIKELIKREVDDKGNVNMTMLCVCDVIKPVLNEIVGCAVDMIHINGLFVNFNGIKMLVSKNGNFEVRDKRCYTKNRVIDIGDMVDVEIINIRYDNKQYSCIGKLSFKDYRTDINE